MTNAVKVYDAPAGVSFDDRRGLYVLAYRETVPPSWGMRKHGRGSLLFGMLSSKAGPAIIGAIIGVLVFGVVGLIVFAAGGYFLGRFTRRGLPPLTGAPDRTGLVREFAVQVEVDNAGGVNVYRELYSSAPKTAMKYQPNWLRLSELASVELQAWDQVFPDDRNRTTDTPAARKARTETRNAEKVVIALKTGEAIDAGWEAQHNAAARIQSSLIGFLRDVGQQLGEQQKQAARVAALDPDDAPL